MLGPPHHFKYQRNSSIQIYEIKLWCIEELSSTAKTRFVCFQTVTFTQKSPDDNDNVVSSPGNGSHSVAILELRPKKFNLMCESPNSAVIYVSVGCPMGRQIRVSNEQQVHKAYSCQAVCSK